MARFVSRYGKYRHGVRPGRFMVLADGQRQEIARDLMAVFEQGILTEDEVQFGITKLKHYGLPIDRDTEEHFSPRSRISGFDSFRAQDKYGWTDDERTMVEDALRNSSHNGSDHLEIIPEPTAIPWPSYLEIESPEEIVTIAKATGTLEQALAFELENRNAAPVLNALREALRPEEAEEGDVVLDAS